MITQLLPDQISKLWDIIKYAVEQSMPPVAGDHPDRMNRILSSMLSGKTQCWVSYEKKEEGSELNAIILTKILYDDTSHTKSLLLYSVYGYGRIDQKFWMEGFAFMSKYAKSHGCTYLSAYTEVPYLIEMAKMYEAGTSYTYITFDISKSVQILNKLGGE